MVYLTSTKWKTPKTIKVMFLLELAGIAASLGFFGYASPDAFRDALWQDGGTNGFNSNPNNRIYYYANHKQPPSIPLVWSPFITQYNVAISVTTMFILLVKVTLFIFSMWPPILSVIVHLCLCAIWAFSVYGQAGPDYSEPPHVSRVPWYISKPCSVAADKSKIHFCELAKGTFAVTILLLVLYFAFVLLSLYSTFRRSRSNRDSSLSFDSQEDITKGSPDSEETADAKWEAQNPPRTPASAMRFPVSPRSQAFNALTRPMPLRGMQNKAGGA